MVRIRTDSKYMQTTISLVKIYTLITSRTLPAKVAYTLFSITTSMLTSCAAFNYKNKEHVHTVVGV